YMYMCINVHVHIHKTKHTIHILYLKNEYSLISFSLFLHFYLFLHSFLLFLHTP
uniref:Uncharacterized protein n=1 Tax=Amphimedon queenslandica TaxID=400682 RepID=A0A1X7U803_AMPQE